MTGSDGETDDGLVVNPDPLEVVEVPRCRSCGRKAPWCSCGKADYTPADDLGTQ